MANKKPATLVDIFKRSEDLGTWSEAMLGLLYIQYATVMRC